VGDEFAAPSGDTLGGGGTRIFRFEVVGQGTCNLEVTLRRSWEPVSAEAERFRATIEAE
jgi:predicted secreted protein